jgi:hypothetical protein
MSYRTEYLADKGIVMVTQAGEVRYASVRREVPSMARLMEKHHTHLALIDLRRASLHLSVPELYFLTSQLVDQGVLPGSRLALVCRRTKANLESYSFYALASRKRGYRTRLFRALTAAKAWLLEGAQLNEEREAD